MKRTTRRMIIYVAFVWLGAACISLPPLLVLGNEYTESEDGVSHCSVCQNFGYQIYATLGSFYIPLFVMITVSLEKRIILFRVVLYSRVITSDAIAVHVGSQNSLYVAPECRKAREKYIYLIKVNAAIAQAQNAILRMSRINQSDFPLCCSLTYGILKPLVHRLKMSSRAFEISSSGTFQNALSLTHSRNAFKPFNDFELHFEFIPENVHNIRCTQRYIQPINLSLSAPSGIIIYTSSSARRQVYSD